MRGFAIVLLIGCSGSGAPGTQTSGSATPAGSAMPADGSTPALVLPASGAFTLPADYTRCAKDDDCQMVTLGCCDETAVNLAHVDEVKRALETSKRRDCPVKAACGPGGDGTWNGLQGACNTGRCEMPAFVVRIPPTGAFTIPADYVSCAKDTDCAVVSLGCADETAVNRGHEVEVRRALAASGRGYRPPKDACGPGPRGVWDGEQGACKAGACTIPKWPVY